MGQGRPLSAAAPALPRTGAAVAVRDLRRAYGAHTVLDGVSCTIEPGELIALTGASGSGKSTLLNIIGGLEAPDAGTVLVDGLDVTALAHPVAYRRTTVGFVFQAHHLLPGLSAQGNVELPLLAAHVHRHVRGERAAQMLARVGLEGREDAPPAELSGGERQRVALARALVHEPRLLLADEPTAALDGDTAERILHMLDEARRDRGMTILAVTYDPALLGRAERTLHLAGGCLTERPGTGGAAT